MEQKLKSYYQRSLEYWKKEMEDTHDIECHSAEEIVDLSEWIEYVQQCIDFYSSKLQKELRMYGDNKANFLEKSFDEIFQRIYLLRNQAKNARSTSKEDILTLMQTSTEITDALNQLYEQMKGE